VHDFETSALPSFSQNRHSPDHPGLTGSQTNSNSLR